MLILNFICHKYVSFSPGSTKSLINDHGKGNVLVFSWLHAHKNYFAPHCLIKLLVPVYIYH